MALLIPIGMDMNREKRTLLTIYKDICFNSEDIDATLRMDPKSEVYRSDQKGAGNNHSQIAALCRMVTHECPFTCTMYSVAIYSNWSLTRLEFTIFCSNRQRGCTLQVIK